MTGRLAVFSPELREDLKWWRRRDRPTALRVLRLIEAALRAPFDGPGNPQPLHRLANRVWSRRITQEHRLVYLVSDDRIDFVQARHHY